MAAGDDEARALGIDVTRVRLLLILAATVMSVTRISFSGIVSWVELLISHIVRMLIGPTFPPILPMCAVVGGGYLLAVDNLCRGTGTAEIRLGILTVLIGVPFFALIHAKTSQAWFYLCGLSNYGSATVMVGVDRSSMM
jgi:iron complex transport system permease protein